ncbi:MAG: sigma-70 family RNA polymerase sigma factor, partial [Candidatus Omnitrophica bacterium]|nr:sigma-70 family RNA polymerase sigma factor [Candidatus Omnitrophota bacterium]
MRKIGSTIIHLQSTGSPKSLRSKELRLKRAVKPAAQPAKTAAESEQIKPVKAKPVPAMDDKFKSLRIKPLLRIDYLQIYNEFKKLIYKETGKSAKLTDILNYAVKAKDWQFVFTVIQRIENSTMKLNRDDRSCVDDAKDAVIAANLEGKPEDRGPYPDKPSKGAGQFGAVQIGDMRSPDESSRNGAPQAAPAAQPQGEPEAAACYSITDMGEYKQILISASPVEGATLEEQGAELLSNIDRILAENGCGRDSVVKQVVFLKDFSDRKKCEEIMGKHYVRGPPPATSYIHQPPINGKSISIEITAIPKQYIERVNSNLTIVEQGGMRWAHVAGVETDAGIEDTYEQSLNIFLKMQRLLEANGFKFDQVVRTWIYVNNILGDDKNRQRYQLLNDARRLFFETGNGGKPIMFADARPPASTGIGMLNGNIVMECLALDSKGKHPRILPIENPEQTSAFLYSDKVLKAGVSPKKKAPPLFSRGMAVISGGFQTILISGTASVKGEKPVHPGDVEKQTETMIENVGLVLGQVGATIRDIPQLRVYIKNIPDYEKVKNIVEAKFPDVPCVFVHADVCRTEWLVEMEAIAYSAKQSPAPDFSDRYLKLERFLAKHGFAYGITTDGSAHWPTPPEALCAIFDILKERYGDLKGRHFFDFGAGDLRASLAAVYLYGMDAAACEKDKIVRGKALRVLRSAEKEGFAGNDNPDLLPAEDALDENWDRHDFVFFFYTHPSDKKEAEDFRAKLQDKMNNMRTGTVAALLFTGDEMALGFNKFPNLHDELSGPIQISDMHDGLYLQLYQAPSAIAGAAAPQSMRIAKPGETPPKSAFEPGSDLGKRWLKQPPEDKRKPGNQDGEPAKITPKQIKRGILIRKVIKKIEESGKNPTFKRITDVIAELAKNRAGIEPLSKTQVIISLRANGIRLKSRLIDDEARIAQIKRITADFLTRHNRKPLLQEVADLMNAESRFEEVNYDNLMKWFEVRKIPWESLGIGKRERGPDVQLKRIIAAVKELAARNRSDKVLLSDIRAALKMKPSAFSNCLRRLREKGIDFKDEMKRIGINIIYSQSTERQGSFRSKKLRLKRTVKPAAQPAKTAAAPPAKAKPVKAEPAAIKPAETKPVEIKPVETKPGPTMDDKFKTLRIKPLPKIYYLETYDLYRMLIDSPRFIDILNYAVKIHDWHFVFTMIQKIEAGGRELTSDDKACVAKAKEALIAATDGAGQFGVVQTGDIPLSDYDGSSGNDTDPAVSSSDAPSPAESSQASPGKTGDGPVRIKNTRTTHADDKRRVRMSSILRGKGMERVPLFVKDTMSDMPELLYVLVVNFLLLFSDFVEIEVISSAENRHAVVKIICRKDEDSREFEFELDYSAYLNLKKEIERRLGGREEAIIVKHYGIPLYLKLGSEGSINIAGISSLTSALIENLTKRKRVWKRRAVLQKIVTAEKSELRIARPDETRGLPGSPNRVSVIFAAEFGDPFAPLAVAQLLGRHPRLDKGFGPAGTYGAYFSDRRGITVSPEFSGSDDIWRLPKSGDSVADIVQEAYKCFGRRQWTIDELRRESRLIKSVPDTVTIDKVARAVSMYLVEPVNIGGNSFRLSAKGLNIAGLLPREKEVSALINRADQYDKLGARVEAKIEREKAARLLAALGRRYYYLENYINSTLCRELYGQINESIKKFRYASKAFLLAGRSYEKMAMYGMAAECYERSAMNRQRTGEQDKIKNPESAIIWALAANSYRKAEMKKEAADCERRVGELRNSTPKAEFAATEPAAVSKLSYGDRKAPDSTKIGPDEARYFVQPAKDTDEAGRKRRRLSRARAIAPAQDPEGKVTDGVNIRVPAVKAPKTPRVKREAPDESPEKEDPYLSPGTLQVNIPPFITGTPARPANLSREIIRNIRSYLDQLDESVASSDLYGSLLDLGILEGVTYERFLAAVRDIGHPKLIQGERPPAANYLDWGSVYRIVPDYEKNHAGIRLTLKQEQELGKEKDKGNAAAWHALYYLNRQLPYAMIRTQLPRIKDTAIDPGDLLSAGISALDRAVTKYDWSRGFKFSTYACDAIDNAYNRYIEQGTRREKKRISNPEDSSAASAIWDRFASLLESSKERPGIVDIGQLSRLLTSLGGLERRVAELRFGFVPPSEEEWRSLHSIFPELARNSDTGWPVGKKSLTLRQTGVIIGLSNEKIRQAEKSALSKLREKVLSKPAAPRKERPAIVKDAKDALKPKPPAEADQSLNYGDRGTGPGENRLGIHHYKPTPEDAQGEWDEIDGFQKIRRRDGKGKERDRQEESAPLNKRALKHKSYNVRPFIAELDREIVPANDVYAPSAELTTFIAGCIDNDLSGRKTLDIGTGTGVLGLIMLKRNAAGVVFADIKPQAIACAKDNVAQLGYDVNNPGLEFICSDLFSGLSARNFDLVVFTPSPIDSWDNSINVSHRYIYREHVELFFKHAGAYLTPSAKVLFRHTVFPDDPRSVNLSSQIERMVNMFAEREGCVLEKKGPHARSVSSVLWRRKGKGAALLIPEETYVYVLTKKISGDTLPTAAGPEIIVKNGNSALLSDRQPPAAPELPAMAEEKADANGVPRSDISQKTQSEIPMEIIGMAMGVSENDQFEGTRLWLLEQLVLAEGGRMSKLEIACLVHEIIEDLKHLVQTGFSENTVNELVKICPNSRKIIERALEMVREDLKINRINRDSALLPKPPAALLRQQTETARGFVGQAPAAETRASEVSLSDTSPETETSASTVGTLNLLGYCGLFCGACYHCRAVFINGQHIMQEAALKGKDLSTFTCLGCRSNKLYMHPGCAECAIRACAQSKGLLHCALCEEYPCERLKEFQQDPDHIHHFDIFSNLQALKEEGPGAWLEKQERLWTCQTCQTPFSWYDQLCPNCHSPVNSYSDETRDLMGKKLERPKTNIRKSEESNLVEPIDFLRNIADAKEVSRNMIEGILSALFLNKKIVLAFNKNLRGYQGYRVSNIVEALD